MMRVTRGPRRGRESFAESFGNYDVIDARIDVGAQKALIRLKGNPATSADAAALLAAVKGGRLQGIFGDDLRAAAQLAARLGTVRWELVPRGRVAALVREPDPATPPTIIFRAQYRDDAARLDPALVAAWRSSLVPPIVGGDIPTSTGNEQPVFHPLLGPGWLLQKRSPATGEAESEVEDDLSRPCPDPRLSKAIGIIGPDDRQFIDSDSTKVPFRFICSLLLFFKPHDSPGPELIFRSTGTLISDIHVLTVGHALAKVKSVCLRDNTRVKSEKYVSRVTVMPGRNGAAVLGSSKMLRARVPRQWDASEDPEFDFGLITLATPISEARRALLPGDQLGFWGKPLPGSTLTVGGTLIQEMTLRALQSAKVNTSGYPGDKCFNRPSVGSLTKEQFKACGIDFWASAQWMVNGLIVNPSRAGTPRLLSHDMDTVRGQSGSPIWVNSALGVRNLVGIVTAVDTSTRNVGLRITEAVLRQLREWMHEDGVTPTF